MSLSITNKNQTSSSSMSPIPNSNDIDSSFKSTLAPRKRAKTDEEKEQRRVERILRNRRAAHASREKKRKHVENLEVKYKTLSSMFQKIYNVLDKEQISKFEEQFKDHKDLMNEVLNLSINSLDEDSTSSQSSPQSQAKPSKKRKLSSVSSNDDELNNEVGSFLQPLQFSNMELLSPISMNSTMSSPIDHNDDINNLSKDIKHSQQQDLSLMFNPAAMNKKISCRTIPLHIFSQKLCSVA